MLRTQLVFSLALAMTFLFGGCVSPPDSPWEITVQLERRVNLLSGRAQIAVRASDIEDPKVIVNVQCEDEERTIEIAQYFESGEVCGLTFELASIAVRSAEAVSATLIVRWDEEEEE